VKTADQAVEWVVRASYGRLLALLAMRSHDIAAAEDALSEALASALVQWPRTGVPHNPDAWLLTAARRRLVDQHRRQVVRNQATETLLQAVAEKAMGGADPVFVDERLRLLFVCTHPALERAVQVPLMLHTVLGLEVPAIASALRVAPKTLGQRLWRAKSKIRDARVPFEVPEAAHLSARLDAVLEANYAAFGTAWDDVSGADASGRDLTREALFLARVVVTLLPRAPEALGLLALLLFADARRAARHDADGQYVALEAQDPTLWDHAQIAEAEALLRTAAALGSIGAFQLEAALQSAHVDGVRQGRTDHAAIAALYGVLVQLAPSLGAQVGHATALLSAQGGSAAIAALDALDPGMAHAYQPWWAVRAAALRAQGHRAEARAAYTRAMGMTEDDATRRFLWARAAELATSDPGSSP
jgi:RNA polymerase sigma-70 factor (ECF subfamily)